MQQPVLPKLRLHDFEPEPDSFREEVIQGLQQPNKELPSKFFYDEHGSQLFDQITELDEYYPTRTEIAIMRQHAHEMAALLGPHCLLIEYGSGSSTKTRILLDHIEDLAGYVPIDISKEHLLQSAEKLTAAYPDLEVLPVCADYTRQIELPIPERVVSRRVVYYPGSTIGNFEPEPAKRFLQTIAEVCGQDGGLLIGVDLKKDPEILHHAYNDHKGVTAEFNLNILARINRELEANFQLDQFRHYAFYNPPKGRIEMHLVSLQNQTVRLDDIEIRFKRGESIWTESSYKYNVGEFERLAAAAGFEVAQVWTDPDRLFSVQYLTRRTDHAYS
jgi:dimethylhistidine N-methyltransferase